MKTKLKKITKLLINKDYRFIVLSPKKMYDHLSDEEYIKRKYHAALGKDLNLENPTTFNEKLQWLKIHNQKDEYTIMVDKYKVREYIAEKIGEQYLIPLLGVWDKSSDIDFENLPDEFVLKCNHNSGLGMCICKDKSKLSIEEVKAELEKGLQQDYYLTCREWPYKNVERKIVCEAFMHDDTSKELKDYKVFNFNGQPKVILVCQDRFTNMTEDFFDEHWNHLDIARVAHPNATKEIEKPEKLEEILELSRILSKDIPFLRTDFYIINDQIYFGELTFYPAGGFEPFVPEKVDDLLGSWIQLPLEK